MKPTRDQDVCKGAVEQEAPDQHGNENFAGQNPHRNASPLAEGQDTDFPEPGQNPEHSGQQISNRNPSRANQSPERDNVDQDPGERQKRNQGDEKDDPLAA